ncbi:nucleotide exchange factor GrpE [Nocardia nepalensis]|uniref:nucleotide exchange factor GrpE n=1 Tax=Nocardia nepalensis TaxID=3375448 RepID=UPI003B66F815
MTEPVAPQPEHHLDPIAPQGSTAAALLAQLAERIEDLTRVIARQATTIDRLADEAKARAQRDRTGADLPLLIELFALHTDTAACATTAESPREREAFDAITTRIERLIVGRGGSVISPRPGDTFDSLHMEAAEVTTTETPDADRTVATTIHPGLTVSGRSVRPAAVVVRRYRTR